MDPQSGSSGKESATSVDPEQAKEMVIFLLDRLSPDKLDNLATHAISLVPDDQRKAVMVEFQKQLLGTPIPMDNDSDDNQDDLEATPVRRSPRKRTAASAPPPPAAASPKRPLLREKQKKSHRKKKKLRKNDEGRQQRPQPEPESVRQPQPEKAVRGDGEDEDQDEDEDEAKELEAKRSVVSKALSQAKLELDWQMILGPFVERELKSKSEESLRQELMGDDDDDNNGDSYKVLCERFPDLARRNSHAEASKDDLVTYMGLCQRLRLLSANARWSVQVLRSAAGVSSGTKDELIWFLAQRFSQSAAASMGSTTAASSMLMWCHSQIVPNQHTRGLLREDAEGTLRALQFATKDSGGVSRLNSFARDTHLAWIWSSLGRTNAEVVGKLNDWFETSHTHSTWLKRRRRGKFLLKYPAFAYQSALALDNDCPSTLSSHAILQLMEASEDLQAQHEALMSTYSCIFGLEKDNDNDNDGDPQWKDEPELHIHGYRVIKGALQVDEATLQSFQRIPEGRFQPIFNNAGSGTDLNDNRRLQMDYAQLKRKVAANLKEQIERVLHEECPNHEIRGMAVLRSKPGCLDQLPHTDYAQFRDDNDHDNNNNWYNWEMDDDDEQVPLGCVVALQDNTQFNVWPEAIRFPQATTTTTTRFFHCVTLVLNRGDVVVFRGDLVHAGAALYDDDHDELNEGNVRVHCYLEPANGGFERPKYGDGSEQTQPVANWRSIIPQGSVVLRESYT